MSWRIRSLGRFIWAALSPLDSGWLNVAISVAIPGGSGLLGFTIAGDSWPWSLVGVGGGVLLLLTAQGVRLQWARDRPLDLVLVDVEAIRNPLFLPLYPASISLVTPVFGVKAEYVNRGTRAVSLYFELRVNDWVIPGSDYDDALRSPWNVLPNSLPNPLHLGASGEEGSNRKGVIGFFVDAEALERRGLSLDDLSRGALVVHDRFARTDREKTFPLEDYLV